MSEPQASESMDTVPRSAGQPLSGGPMSEPQASESMDTVPRSAGQPPEAAAQ